MTKIILIGGTNVDVDIYSQRGGGNKRAREGDRKVRLA